MKRALVETVVLEEHAVLGQALAMISGEHNQRSFAEAHLIQRRHDVADPVIEMTNLLIVKCSHVIGIGHKSVGST